MDRSVLICETTFWDNTARFFILNKDIHSFAIQYSLTIKPVLEVFCRQNMQT